MTAINRRADGLSKQRGAIDLVVIFAIMFGIILVISAIKIFPLYMDHWSIEEAAQAVVNEGAESKFSKKKLRGMLQKRLEVNRIDFLSVDDFDFERTKTTLSATLGYERRVPLVFNIDVVLKFPEQTMQAELSSG